MKKLVILFILLFTFISCEVDYYAAYRFRVDITASFIPYYPTYYDSYYYDLYNITPSQAYDESRRNNHTYNYYNNGYYVTEKRYCTYYKLY